MTTKDLKPKPNSAIYEQAADWIVDLREDEVDADMRERLDAWFRSSPEHIRAYLELASIWEEGADPDLDAVYSTETLMALVRSSRNIIPLSSPRTTAQGVKSADGHSELRQLVPPSRSVDQVSRRSRRGRQVWLSGAVAACLIAAMSFYVYSQRNITFVTETGEQRFEKLIDGSTIELNSNSRVRVRFSAGQRNVDLLEGQALFHVAKDASRPFIVHSDSTLVRAVGTQFDVYRKPSGTVVTVVEGRVAVLSPWLSGSAPVASDSVLRPSLGNASTRPSDATRNSTVTQASESIASSQGVPIGGALYLSAGEQVTVGSQSKPRPMRADASVATAWVQHELVFDSTPLSDVAREFNRYNTRRLVVDARALDTIHITGIFSSTDPGALIKFLRTQGDLIVLESDEEIRIARK